MEYGAASVATRLSRGNSDGSITHILRQVLCTMTLLAWRSPFQGVGVGIETPMVFQIEPWHGWCDDSPLKRGRWDQNPYGSPRLAIT